MLFIAATPIGNLRDASPRLIECLGEAELIVAEDTRSTRQLMNLLGVSASAPLWALHEHNEGEIVQKVLEVARDKRVVLVSDAGMPTVSDPGYLLVREAHLAGIEVSPIPGPSAVISALAASGLPTDRWTMEGFVPRKGKRGYFESLASEPRTMVFFESPQRLHDTLRLMAEVWGADRLATVCRELTKKFEEVRQDSLGALAEYFSAAVKGELTLVVHGAVVGLIDFDDALGQVRALMAEGAKPAEAAREVAKRTGIPKRSLYDAARERGA